jgi:hypothetical protein
MNPSGLITGSYERKARLYPALLLVAPVVATAVACLPVKWSALQSIGTAIIVCGGAFLLSQLARDNGKKREKNLLELWGGLPSVAIFRHRDTRLDPITKGRYHEKLVSLVKGTKAPTVEEEQSDQAAADQIYAAWSNYLRVNTRDTKKYPLLFQENVNYGYRRNVWGLRHIGILICAVCGSVAGVRLWQLYQATGNINEEIVGAIVFVFVLLTLWAFRFSAEWVRVPAYAYAERLAETVETLGAKTGAHKK